MVVLHAYSDINIWPKDQAEYLKMKEEKANELIALAANVIPELADPRNIEVKEIITPVTLEEFTMNQDGDNLRLLHERRSVAEDPQRYARSTTSLSPATGPRHGIGVGSCQINGWRAARLILDREGIE